MTGLDKIVEHCLSRLGNAKSAGGNVKELLTRLVETALEVSLVPEEGLWPRFSLSLDLSQGIEDGVASWPKSVAFSEPIVIKSTKRLRKLAALSELGNRHLVATFRDGMFRVSGLASPPTQYRWEIFACSKQVLTASVIGPMHIIIECGNVELAYVRHGQLSEGASVSIRKVQELLRAGPSPVAKDDRSPFLNMVNRLLRPMWLLQKGGILAVTGTDDSAEGSFTDGYSIDLPGAGLMDMLLELHVHTQTEGEREYGGDTAGAFTAGVDATKAEEALDAMVHDIVRMSAVDGAVMLTPGLVLEGFGRKLTALPGVTTDERVSTAIRVCDEELTPLGLSTFGTRHSSAVSWVASRPSRMAFVVSEDSQCSLVVWNSGCVVLCPFRPPLFS